ncbi:FecR family protein [Calycomorphotria hydatis]|uniref:FecR protein n=1 Tax=Calycomorphotria hydatis TaxID=2528027 RepID=A0A517TDN2_9PLAN|nr:hypothetical protein [Calycomorphotria hydatis]QDT66485.1 FecR protein [Calycomorphotria hydatis]
MADRSTKADHSNLELRELLNDVMNGDAGKSQVSRLNDLLQHSGENSFDAVNQLVIATEMRQAVNLRDPASDLVEAAKKHERGVSRTKQKLTATIGVISALAMMVVVGIAISLINPAPPEAGKLVGLTADAVWSGKEYAPGDLILERMSVTLKEGVASFELKSGAIVSIQGPATIEATSGIETRLVSGLLHAIIPEKAIGYTVRTLDAEVIDLGTEFTVERKNEFGTRVVVKQGKVEARTISSDTEPGSVHELTAGRAMEFQFGTGVAQELASMVDWEDQFENFENARGGIAKLEGIVRTTPSLPADLRPGQTPTNNFIMLVRECTGITLSEDLVLQQSDGPVTIQAGTVVDSYLIHFDPIDISIASPIGNVTFDQPIYAVATKTDDLIKTDNMCAVTGSLYTQEQFRGLESENDPVEISPDRKSLTFHFSRSPPVEMDQCRIFLKHAEPSGLSTTINE